MKKFLKNQLILIVFYLCFFPCEVKSNTDFPSLTLTTYLHVKSDDNHYVDYKINKRNRTPAYPITIFISVVDGVQIPHVENNEIFSYAVYDEDETCLATFTDEADFVDFVFSTTGEVEIRIELADYYLCGWLQL